MSILRNLRRRRSKIGERFFSICEISRNRKLAEIGIAELLNAIMLMNLYNKAAELFNALQYMCVKNTTRTIKI